MIADIQRLENAARMSMGTFSDIDPTPSSTGSYGFAAVGLLVALAAPILAVFLYY